MKKVALTCKAFRHIAQLIIFETVIFYEGGDYLKRVKRYLLVIQQDPTFAGYAKKFEVDDGGGSHLALSVIHSEDKLHHHQPMFSRLRDLNLSGWVTSPAQASRILSCVSGLQKLHLELGIAIEHKSARLGPASENFFNWDDLAYALCRFKGSLQSFRLQLEFRGLRYDGSDVRGGYKELGRSWGIAGKMPHMQDFASLRCLDISWPLVSGPCVSDLGSTFQYLPPGLEYLTLDRANLDCALDWSAMAALKQLDNSAKSVQRPRDLLELARNTCPCDVPLDRQFMVELYEYCKKAKVEFDVGSQCHYDKYCFG